MSKDKLKEVKEIQENIFSKHAARLMEEYGAVLLVNMLNIKDNQQLTTTQMLESVYKRVKSQIPDKISYKYKNLAQGKEGEPKLPLPAVNKLHTELKGIEG